jgi:hypothetical protein
MHQQQRFRTKLAYQAGAIGLAAHGYYPGYSLMYGSGTYYHSPSKRVAYKCYFGTVTYSYILDTN